MTPRGLDGEAATRRPSAQRLVGLGGRFLAEPLVHFLIAGAVLFAAGHAYQSQTDLHRIVVTPAHINQLANDYALQFGGPPAPGTLTALIKRDLHDEILYRQALSLKLDQDDQIVRRRLVQKMQFLLQDTHPPAEPTDAQLQAYYAAHADHYRTPSAVTFTHIFFSSDQGGDAAAKARAQAVLKTLKPGVTRAPDLGDPFPDLYDFSAYDPEQVERLFGHTPFTDATLTAPVGRWSGPYKSAYGWHLLYVGERKASASPPLSAVRDQVRTDALQDAQDQANDKAFADLARQYHIVRSDQTAAAAP